MIQPMLKVRPRLKVDIDSYGAATESPRMSMMMMHRWEVKAHGRDARIEANNMCPITPSLWNMLDMEDIHRSMYSAPRFIAVALYQ